MALPTNLVWYVGSTKWTAATAWATGTVKAAGVLVRQNTTPTIGNERVFVSIVAGTTHATTEPTWAVTKGATTTDNTVTWQECTGQSAVNGDVTNTPGWTTIKNNAIALGYIIKRDNAVSYQICTTAGTAGNGAEPAFSDTAGTTTADNTVTWTSLGAVGNFGAYAAAHSRLTNSLATNWAAAGNTVYVSNNHAETKAASSIVSFTNAAGTSPVSVVCVSDTVAPPTTLATTATVSTTGNFNITISGGPATVYGVTFSAGSGAVSRNISVTPDEGSNLFFDTCGFKTAGTSGGLINLGSTSSVASDVNTIIILNSTFVFSSTGSAIVAGTGRVRVSNSTFAGTGSVPVTLIGIGGSYADIFLHLINCDMANVTGTILGNSAAAGSISVTLENCKLGAGVALTSGNNGDGAPGHTMRMHNCDSAATNYRIYNYHYFGTLQSETTIIHTGGASDGVTGLSWNITTSAFSTFYQPFISEEIAVWNNLTGSALTATIEINSGGTLTNADLYLEIEYLGNASFPVGSLANNRATAIFTTPTNVTSSTATWAGSLSGSTPQKLQVSFTPQMKGPVKARIYVAKASQTVYIDPLITLT